MPGAQRYLPRPYRLDKVCNKFQKYNLDNCPSSPTSSAVPFPSELAKTLGSRAYRLSALRLRTANYTTIGQ
jgi:hypothetical protein